MVEALKDALTSGVGSLFATNPQMQMATQMFNFGSDSSPSGRGNQLLKMATQARDASPASNFSTAREWVNQLKPLVFPVYLML